MSGTIVVNRERWERFCEVLSELRRLNYERPGALGEQAKAIMSEILTGGGCRCSERSCEGVQR